MLEKLIKKEMETKIFTEIKNYLTTKECQILIKRVIIREIKSWLNDSSIEDILNDKNYKRFYDAIEEAIIKRLSL